MLQYKLLSLIYGRIEFSNNHQGLRVSPRVVTHKASNKQQEEANCSKEQAIKSNPCDCYYSILQSYKQQQQQPPSTCNNHIIFYEKKMESTSETENGGVSERAKAVAWDPKSPSILLVPSFDKNEDDDCNDDDVENKPSFVMNTASSDLGSGCNKFETSAIMRLLDSRDAYLNNAETVGSYQALKQLSTNYCNALSVCIAEWTDHHEKEKAEAGGGGEKMDIDATSLELLKMAYSVIQLSETFLLLPGKSAIGGVPGGTFGYYEDYTNLPGAFTADTVRHLRLHHLGDGEDKVGQDVVEEMENSIQPDQFEGGEPYWTLIKAYMVRGCLEVAWLALSNHSIARRIAESDQQEVTDDYFAASNAEWQESFQALRDILLSAPIPGGRNSDYDTLFETDQDRDAATNPSLVETEYVEGIPSNAYLLWETGGTSRGGDSPVHFEPHAAQQMWRSWQEAIKSIPAIKRLRSKIPQLSSLLEMLCGNFSHIEFDTWEEELCAELLYKRPEMRQSEIPMRTAQVMKEYSDSRSPIEAVILNVMKGNSGEVIRVLDGLGGKSGAALPATIVSLYSTI